MKVPNIYRVRKGQMGSDDSYGNNGLFQIRYKGCNFNVIASDGLGWEHVSVSLEDRIPAWEEMCYMKDLFWNKDEAVMQLHPPESEYINNHDFCLHLWKPLNAIIPLPDSILVGVK